MLLHAGRVSAMGRVATCDDFFNFNALVIDADRFQV